mmetsp:Transcript_29541/g.41560  ORF Transcript_29541/g.41560 Transcript_29541/m.41560 type:complete len:680 (+) Transcript_29541:82-2121(+)
MTDVDFGSKFGNEPQQKDNKQGGRGARTARVKNKTPAPVQITAEQILREAMAFQEGEAKAPRQEIADQEELADYQYNKRKTFEDNIRRNRNAMGVWLKYAEWEENQREYTRARSIYERGLEVDYRNPVIWIKYAEMEMKHKNINAARNVFDRAVVLLPRVDQFWYKYSYMEHILGNYAGARQIFERWMEWEPNEYAWTSYIRFEIKCGEIDRARAIYQRFVKVHPQVQTWLKWAKFEEKYDPEAARRVYEQAIEFLGEEANDENLFIAFAKFEEKAKEVERARAIYKYALDHIPKKEAQELYKLWISFEKKNGDRQGIEDVIIGKRRFQYEEEIKLNPANYDSWFDYARLEETYGELEKIRDVYERAIANIPPATEKRLWRRYIYLWINYALFEELEAKDMQKARQVYKECIRLIPHKSFSFSKIWIMFANFEVRQKNLQAARSVFGHAMGVAPKDKIFTSYIELESQLGNFDRARTIFEKWLEWSPHNCNCWVRFSQLEKNLGEYERVRAIFELAISQPLLDMPELIWKAFIDFEIEQEEYDRARELYKRLLERTKHVKVWISYAQFENTIQNVEEAKKIYAEAFDVLKNTENKEERVMLLDSWKEFAAALGDKEYIAQINKKTPKKVIKKRPLQAADGSDAGWEEYYDYIFPGEDTGAANLKLLERARMWKKQKESD